MSVITFFHYFNIEMEAHNLFIALIVKVFWEMFTKAKQEMHLVTCITSMRFKGAEHVTNTFLRYFFPKNLFAIPAIVIHALLSYYL